MNSMCVNYKHVFLAAFSAMWTALAQEPQLEANFAFLDRRNIVVFGKDLAFGTNDLGRDIVVIGGNATIDGSADRNVVVIFGSAKVNGNIGRNLVTVLGSAELGPMARINGEAIVIGGKFIGDTATALRGHRFELVFGETLPDLQWLGDWALKGLLFARPLPPQLKWSWAVAGLFLLLYLLLATLFPRPAQACGRALETRPASSLMVGMLSFVLIGPLIFLLAVSIIGIAVIPFVLLAWLGGILFGKVAIYETTGRKLGQRLNLTGLQAPAAALIVGVLIFYMLYTVPVLGFIVLGLGTVWGLGAVVIAIFSSFQREKPAAIIRPISAPISPEPNPTEPLAPPVTAPDAVVLERAGFWIRFCATLLDFILLGGLIGLIGPFFLVFWIGYHIGMWMWKGTTIGGIVTGLKVIRLDGKALDFSVTLVRGLSSVFSIAALGLGFLWAGWDSQRQSWHDKIAGTVIVRVPKGISLV